MWMGGMTPVGYLSKDRTLEIDESHANRVREVYQLYLDLDCVRRLQKELQQRGWLTPHRESKRDGQQGGRPFSRGHLYRLLSNPVYAGKSVHKDQVFEGMHPAIVDTRLWEAVQDRLSSNRQGQKVKAHALERSLLSGRVFDAAGNPLSASHSNKGQRRYRYYVGPGVVADGDEAPLRVPASDLEGLVQGCLLQWLSDESQLLPYLQGLDPHRVRETLQRAKTLAEQLNTNIREHLPDCVERVVVGTDSVSVTIRLTSIGLEEAPGPTIDIAAAFKRCGLAVRLVVNAPGMPMRRTLDSKLIGMLQKSQDWLQRLTSGQCDGVAAIAADESITTSYVTRAIYLSFLAPDIVDLIVKGEQPVELNLERLMRLVPLPADWAEQRRLLGIAK
jgi:hypothetical protein